MRARKKFDIHIYKLSNGIHEYEFEIRNEFFEMFEGDLVSEGELKAIVTLNKSDSMIQVDFDIEGTVVLECDRSLDLFDFPIHVERNMIYKYGDEEKELSEDVYVIEKNTQTLNIAGILFEYIGLEIPMKKLHPKFEDEDEDSEGTMIYVSEEEDQNEQEEETIDPRWAALKNLKNKK
ncbi:YceD family protein [Roseivirga sp.]|uniref:YceD family protein n=1 Tax=Roseivirga sp. TaxID=1964215 RepID=UPI003B51F06E